MTATASFKTSSKYNDSCQFWKTKKKNVMPTDKLLYLPPIWAALWQLRSFFVFVFWSQLYKAAPIEKQKQMSVDYLETCSKYLGFFLNRSFFRQYYRIIRFLQERRPFFLRCQIFFLDRLEKEKNQTVRMDLPSFSRNSLLKRSIAPDLQIWKQKFDNNSVLSTKQKPTG